MKNPKLDAVQSYHCQSGWICPSCARKIDEQRSEMIDALIMCRKSFLALPMMAEDILQKIEQALEKAGVEL